MNANCSPARARDHGTIVILLIAALGVAANVMADPVKPLAPLAVPPPPPAGPVSPPTPVPPVAPTPIPKLPPAPPAPGAGTPQPPATPKFLACVEKNGNVKPGVPVRQEPFGTPRLAELRRRERLEEVVAPGRDEFDKILLLKNWVAAQFPHGNPDPYPPWDAITVLDWIRGGKTGGFCGQYSQVLLQSLVSLGMNARYVELGGAWNPYVHFVVEVWSNQFNKWVVLDADYNVHFERNGIPLSVLEVHDALVQSKLADVDTIQGEFLEGHYDAYEWPLKLAEVFYYFRVHLKADHLSATREPPFDRWNDMVEFMDPLTLPWELNPGPSSYVIERLTNQQSGRRGDFAGKLNQVRVTVDAARPELRLNFDNNVFEFDRYQVRVLEPELAGGGWLDYKAATYPWPTTWANRVLEVRGVNSRGVPGPASRVRVCSTAQGASCTCDAP